MATLTGYVLQSPENSLFAVVPPWLANPVFNTHPIGYDQSGFIYGPMTSTQPVDENPQNFGGYVLTNFAADFYNRMTLEPPLIDAGNVSSNQVRTISLFNGFFTPVTITSILQSLTDGIVLTGISAPLLMQPLSTIIFTATISTEGPPDINADFQFTFDSYTPLVLHIGGSRIIVIPYQAIAGFEEELEWLSEVITANDGSEQRIQHRQKPRQSFNGQYFVPYDQVSRVDNIVYGWLGKRWAIAVWSESQITTLPTSTDTIPCETGTTDIRAGGLVMIWANPTKYEIIEVAVINTGNIVLTRPTVNDYPRALVMPVRSGLAGERMRVTKNGTDAFLTAAFEVTDNIMLTPAAPAQFLGEDIYFDDILMERSFTDEYKNRIDRVDFGTAIETYRPWKYRTVRRTHHFVCQDRSETWAFRNWLHRRDGKIKPFWQPTMEANFTPVMSGIVSNSITVANNDWRGLAEDRKHIAIQYMDNSWRTATIMGSAVVDDSTYAIAIDISLNTPATNIKRISLLTLKRLDTDVVTIEHIGNAVCQADIPMLEILP